MSCQDVKARLAEEAAEWAVRVDGGAMPPEEQAHLETWLGDDIGRLGAYARARAMLIQARRVKALGPDFSTTLPTANDPADSPPNDSTRHTRRGLLIGGTAVAAAGTATVLGFGWSAAAKTYTTELGEVRRVSLEGGSSMTLNTTTQAKVSAAKREYRIELIEGEALFDVSEGASNPIVVIAGETIISAYSTSFLVRRLRQQPVEILVSRGSVDVSRHASPLKDSLRIQANRRVTTKAASPLIVMPAPEAEVERALAWRRGMLTFEDTPLADAAQQFARYSDIKLQFSDPRIGAKTITGSFASNDPKGFAQTVALSLGLSTSEKNKSIILTH